MSAPEFLWCSPPDLLVLGYDEVHVWCATLDLPLSCVQSLEQTLAAAERTRAQRFRFPKDRSHFVVARGILRVILGRYLASDPRPTNAAITLRPVWQAVSCRGIWE